MALATFGGPILLLLVGAGLGFAAYRVWRDYGQYWRPMRRLTRNWLHEIQLPGGPDGDTFVEHVALLPGGLLVLHIMDFNGAIFGARNTDFWTQVLDRRSYRFPNPSEKLKATTGAVRAAVGDEQVVGHIVFSDSCSFPKGIPEGVSTARELTTVLEDLALGTVSESRREAWDGLKNQVSGPQSGKTSSSYLGNWNRFVFRAILALGLVLSSILWSGWVIWQTNFNDI